MAPATPLQASYTPPAILSNHPQSTPYHEYYNPPPRSSDPSRRIRLGLQIPPQGRSQADTCRLNTNVLVARSPTSTRSVIDPSSSPASSTRPLPPETLSTFQGSPNVPQRIHAIIPTLVPEAAPEEDQPAMAGADTQRRQKSSQRKEGERRRRCFPNIANHALRSKIITCLISGGALAAILAICMASSMFTMRTVSDQGKRSCPYSLKHSRQQRPPGHSDSRTPFTHNIFLPLIYTLVHVDIASQRPGRLRPGAKSSRR